MTLMYLRRGAAINIRYHTIDNPKEAKKLYQSAIGKQLMHYYKS